MRIGEKATCMVFYWELGSGVYSQLMKLCKNGLGGILVMSGTGSVKRSLRIAKLL